MGDFVGGMLKYLRAHPVPRVTIAGGVAKMTKLRRGGSICTPSAARSNFARSPLWRGTADACRRSRRDRGRPIPPPRLLRGARAGRGAGRCRRRPGLADRGRGAGGHWQRAGDRGVRPAGALAGRAADCAGHALMRGNAACSRGRTARSRGTPLPPERGRPAPERCARRPSPAMRSQISPSVPRRICSSGQLARTTIATGQSAP